MAQSPRKSRSLLPRDGRGAVDLDVVTGLLDVLDPMRPRGVRSRASLATLLGALDALQQRADIPAAQAVPTAVPDAPTVLLHFEEPAAEPEPTEPPAFVAPVAAPPPVIEEPARRSVAERATFAPEEPAPFAPERPSAALLSLPPTPAEDSVVPGLVRHATPAVDGLLEPSIPPPSRLDTALPGEPELQLSLPPLEPVAIESVALVIPRGEPSAGLRAMMEDVSVRSIPPPAEALELDLSELGQSDAPPALSRHPVSPSERGSGHDDEAEALDLEEVIELEDVRVARDPSLPSTPLRKIPRAPAPPLPPPMQRKAR